MPIPAILPASSCRARIDDRRISTTRGLLLDHASCNPDAVSEELPVQEQHPDERDGSVALSVGRRRLQRSERQGIGSARRLTLGLGHVVLGEHRVDRRLMGARLDERLQPPIDRLETVELRAGHHGVDRSIAHRRVGGGPIGEGMHPYRHAALMTERRRCIGDGEHVRSADRSQVERRRTAESTARPGQDQDRDHAHVQQRRDQEAPFAQAHPEVASGDQPPGAAVGRAHETTSRNNSCSDG